MVGYPMNIVAPGKDQLTDNNGAPVPAWYRFFSNVAGTLTAITGSGTTAQRPTKLLFTGRQWYDTTLSIPIYYNAASGTGWRNAAGANV